MVRPRSLRPELSVASPKRARYAAPPMKPYSTLCLLASVVASASATAATLTATYTGFYASDGTHSTQAYATGVLGGLGEEHKGYVVFDLSVIAPGTVISSATALLPNPASLIAGGGIDHLATNLYGIPSASYANWASPAVSLASQLYLHRKSGAVWHSAGLEHGYHPGGQRHDHPIRFQRCRASVPRERRGNRFRRLRVGHHQPRSQQLLQPVCVRPHRFAFHHSHLAPGPIADQHSARADEPGPRHLRRRAPRRQTPALRAPVCAGP